MQRPNRVVALIAMVSLAGLCQSATAQTIIYVKADATGANNGTSWTDAFTHPQASLAAAAPIAGGGTPVQIWVAAGLYMPDGGSTSVGGPHVNGTGNRLASFQLINNLTLYGGFAGTEMNVAQRDVDAHSTILSGDLIGNDGPGFANNAENSIHVVVASSAITTAVLDGFTITGGNATLAPFDNFGGGIAILGHPTILNCTFRGNSADGYGGGLGGGGSVTLMNCRFLGNAAGGNGGGCDAHNSTIANCAFSGNTATQFGGGLSGDNSTTIVNCTFSRNTAAQSGGGLNYATPTGGQLINSIIWNNSAPSSPQIAGTPAVTNCDVQGGALNADPLFVDDDGLDNIVGTVDDDLRLKAYSQCLDAGINAAVPADAADLDGDSNITEPIPYDLASLSRFVDSCMLDTGVGSAPVVDLGAFEYQMSLPVASQGIVYVKGDAVGNNDGMNWDNAFIDLRDALCAASANAAVTQVWVATGTYMPDGGLIPAGGSHVVGTRIRSASFRMQSNLRLLGGFAGTETSVSQRDIEANPTTLSGDLNGDDGPGFSNNGENSYHVIVAATVDETAILDGFTITGGNANLEPFDNFGGGIAILGPPTILNCTFRGNSAAGGGGGGFAVGGAGNATFRNCHFLGNASGSDGGGGRSAANSVISNCVFLGNSAVNSGGGLFANDSKILNSTFLGNSAGVNGGGGIVTNAIVANCVFAGNSANDYGGGLVARETQIVNCTFSGNTAAVSGGGLSGFVNQSSQNTRVVNCTFWGNSAGQRGGGLEFWGGGNYLINSICWSNSATNGPQMCLGDHATGSVSHSDVQGGQADLGVYGAAPTWNWLSGNVNLDPMLVNPAGTDTIVGTGDDNLQLQTASPCIDRGDSSAIPIDTSDIDSDSNTTEPISRDLAGNARQIDVPSVTDLGSGLLPNPDMGAFEAGFDRFFSLSSDSLTVPEGSATAFSVRLTWNPEHLITVNSRRVSGNQEINVVAGQALLFDSSDFLQPKSVVVGLTTGSPNPNELAVIGVSASGYPTSVLTAQGAGAGLPPVLYVNSTAPVGGNGLSWATAYRDVQDAINTLTAAGGFFSQIWVSAGTYRPSIRNNPADPRSASFWMRNNMRLLGGFSGTETSIAQRNIEANSTVLSGDLSGDDGPSFSNNGENSYHVVIAANVDATAVLDGFTITGGNANFGPFDNFGGGIVNSCSTCGPLGSPTLLNCTFANNYASGIGGGLNISAAWKSSIIGCRFLGNVAGYYGGGGIVTNAIVANCVFAGNSANDYGGGLVARETQIVNCTFSGNTAAVSGGGLSGFVNQSSQNTRVVNCTFWGNSAGQRGGGLEFWGGGNYLINSICWSNSATNGPQMCLGDHATGSVSHSDVQGGQADLGVYGAAPT